MAEKIHDGERIEAFLHRGCTPYLLVTFNPFGFKFDGTSYWAKALVEKNGINCLAVVSKRSNWFPKSAVEPLLAKVNPLLTEFAGRILTYGSSMGAYAAIKHSRALGASTVIAVAPQFSVDPADVGQFERRGFCSYFDPAINAGMSIAKCDISGEVFLIIDPREQIDMRHAKLVYGTGYDRVHEIRMPFTGHHTVEALAGSGNILSLFDACLAGDVGTVTEHSRKIRKASAVRKRHLARTTATRHPGWAESIFTKYRHDFDERSTALLYEALAQK